MRYDDFMSRAGYEQYGSSGSGNSGCGGPTLLIMIGIAFPPVGIILLIIYFIASISDSIATSQQKRKDEEKRMHELAEKYLSASKALTDKRYDEAIKQFEALGNYYNSETMLAKAHDSKNEDTYQKALEHFEKKEYDEAAALFSIIQDYRDSTAQLMQIETIKSRIKAEIKRELLPFTTSGSIVPFGKRKWVVLECSGLESRMISKEGIRMIRPESLEWQRQVLDELSEAERIMVTMSDHGRTKCGEAKNDLQVVTLLSEDDYLRFKDLIPPMDAKCEWWLSRAADPLFRLQDCYVGYNGNVGRGFGSSKQKAIRPVICVSLEKMLNDPDYEQDKLFSEFEKKEENNQHREVIFGRFSIPGISQHSFQMKWEVLDTREGNSLLLSKEGICLYVKLKRQNTTRKSYNIYSNYRITIRDWLNEVFYYSCFSESEKKSIFQKQSYNSSEYVFLMSGDDVLHYFDTAESRKCTPSNLVKMQMRIDPHTKTVAVPWLVLGNDKNNLSYISEEGYYGEEYIYCKTLDDAVSQYGLLDSDRIYSNIIKKLVIRPAMWVDLKKLEKLRMKKSSSASHEKVKTQPDEIKVTPDLSDGQNKKRKEKKKENNDTPAQRKNSSSQTKTPKKKSPTKDNVITPPKKGETLLPETSGKEIAAKAAKQNHVIPSKEDLVEIGFSTVHAEIIEEILLKSQEEESPRMSAYRMIIHKYGQRNGLEIYNKIKPFL